MEELLLLRAIQAGDPAALESLFDQYADRLYRLTAGLLGDEADAEYVTY